MIFALIIILLLLLIYKIYIGTVTNLVKNKENFYINRQINEINKMKQQIKFKNIQKNIIKKVCNINDLQSLISSYDICCSDKNSKILNNTKLCKKLSKFVKKKKKNNPGESCIYNSKTNLSNCNNESICLPINNSNDETFKEGICSAGEDGINPVSPSNGKIHYYPITLNSEGCKYSKNILCPPNYTCENNKCIRNQMQIPKLYIPKNKSVNRLEFIPPIVIENNIPCPLNYTLIYDKYSQYCKHDSDQSKLCRLDLNGDKDISLCDTFPCPKNYVNKNGICENKNGDICSLEYNENKNYSLCGDLNMFAPIDGKDIRNNTLRKYKNVNADECQQKCYNNKECDGFSMLQNVSKPECNLKKLDYDESNIKKAYNKILYVKTPLNYKMELDAKIENDELKTDESNYVNTPYRCAEECDKLTDCVGFVYDKDKLKCKMYSNILKKKTDNNSILFTKYFTGRNLCKSIEQSKIQKDINKELKYMQNEYDYKFKKYKIENKPNKNEIKKEKIIEYNDKVVNSIPSKLFIWENIKIKCKKIIIKNYNNQEIKIKDIVINSLINGKNINIIEKFLDKIKISLNYDVTINFDKEYEIFKIFILFEHIQNIPIILNIYDKNNKKTYCKTDYKLSIIDTNLKKKKKNNEQINENNNKNCNNYTPDFGFYYKNNIYLFRKIYIYRKKILLITILNSSNYTVKLGYPKLANIDFPGINKYVENLKSCLYLGDGNVLFITNSKYLKYNIIIKKLYDNYPKIILNNWFGINFDYKSNITNAIYIDKNSCILFNNNKYKIYYLNMIEKNINKNIIFEQSIKKLIPNAKDIIYNCIIYNFDNKEYILFENNNLYKYVNDKVSKLIIGYQITDKLWKLNY